MIFHAKDDEVVYFEPTYNFTKTLGCKFIPLKTGGHLSVSSIKEGKFWNKIKEFTK